ncbi:hypothetical protein Tsubulata_014439 [Turnera subulata]|uniref:mitogen-activated protein kinase kinase kinase n=1 Tax=Turnera subulata TaxID=218843 RepID=A0A9Q0FPV8_9ROSI|nr:hypothetical protein Tsubulata_014439 [Turnera subulata]
MHHLPQFFTRSNRTGGQMNPKNRRRSGPRLERRNAAKHIEYDAASSSSSLDDASTSSSLVTRSLDFTDRTSFRIEGTDGEFDRVCRSLGLSGPDDFAIPAAEWLAMKSRSVSDLLPRSRLFGVDSPRAEPSPEPEESDLCARVSDSVRIVCDSATALTTRGELTQPNTGSCDVVVVGGGIKGARPPVLKPPPSMALPVMDNQRSTWDLFRDLAPESGEPHLKTIPSASSSSDDEEEEEIVGGGEQEHDADGAAAANEKRGEEEEDNLLRTEEFPVLSESCSFTTSNDDDSSSSTTEPMSYISPNGRIRRIITDWQKGELLGRGSFGSVYEGISDDGFFFAVKEVSLLDQGSQAKQSIYQLEQEIALLSQFEHENIVQYYGTQKDGSKLYIFLELVTKGSLLSLYQKYDLRDSQVSAYTRQILHGLKYLHDRNVVHRDIKCANILVDANGSVKLADFGLAKATKLNDVKSCKGTAFWMAPEVVNRKTQGYGLPADIWSLGCTVLEMLTSQIPYSELEPMAALFKIGRGIPPAVPDSLSNDARDFILQCLQVNPNYRPSAALLLDHPFVRRRLSTSLGSASPYIGRRS